MARKLKTYETSLGFFDLAIAAPSMKAALDAWGADSNLFHQGVARQSEDPDVVAATMEMPGVVLKRPVGSNGPFKQNADLPTAIEDGRSKKSTRKSTTSKAPKRFKPAGDKAAERAAAVAYVREQKQRDRERAREEAIREKERKRRQAVVEKAENALNVARERHTRATTDLRNEIEALEQMVRTENQRWEKERRKLEAALKRARI
ncbi:cell envelope biogenesis protein TolA [Bradyrhizobium roseum]|uniref:cell envelope biogenesis protein TolA n=1 Tax=Bradyrhizobium roseum TaxID=3056648 RepID=UPI002603C010|nr:cell envelope biogenesis protein TolA [Bradyrhizobium roseus]WKA29793.1 cell envelope biogenesis protein TolA [Bradyrhizobium roseus]